MVDFPFGEGRTVSPHIMRMMSEHSHILAEFLAREADDLTGSIMDAPMKWVKHAWMPERLTYRHEHHDYMSNKLIERRCFQKP